MRISKIILYDEPAVPEIQIEKLIEFLTNTFNIKVQLKGNFFKGIKQQICKDIASTKVFDLKNNYKKHIPTIKEIQFEKENHNISKDMMSIYDGFELQNVIAQNISITEETLHVIITNKLIGTFDQSDYRYHARVIVGANPMIISTTGMIEAPAKSKKYYIEQMTNIDKDKINESYKGEFLEYHDRRLNHIIEGCMLQVVLYYETGEAFCQDRECRLFNAHWQKDLLDLQVIKKTICQKHLKVIEQIKKSRD